jgi:hypothetical protein
MDVGFFIRWYIALTLAFHGSSVFTAMLVYASLDCDSAPARPSNPVAGARPVVSEKNGEGAKKDPENVTEIVSADQGAKRFGAVLLPDVVFMCAAIGYLAYNHYTTPNAPQGAATTAQAPKSNSGDFLTYTVIILCIILVCAFKSAVGIHITFTERAIRACRQRPDETYSNWLLINRLFIFGGLSAPPIALFMISIWKLRSWLSAAPAPAATAPAATAPAATAPAATAPAATAPAATAPAAPPTALTPAPFPTPSPAPSPTPSPSPAPSPSPSPSPAPSSTPMPTSPATPTLTPIGGVGTG